jgi:GcrA cell cycle regulator
MNIHVWTPEKVETLKQRWAEGDSPQLIAQRLSVTVPAVHQKAWTLGISRHYGDWTEERIALLKELFLQGTNAWVATEINRRTGSFLSRNAVIGKAGRLGLERPPDSQFTNRWNKVRDTRRVVVARRGFDINPKNKRQKIKETKEHTASAVHSAQRQAMLDATELTDLPPEDASKAVSFMELSETTCRWPVGDPKSIETIKFCGDNPLAGKPYCTRHCRMAYQPRHDPKPAKYFPTGGRKMRAA